LNKSNAIVARSHSERPNRPSVPGASRFAACRILVHAIPKERHGAGDALAETEVAKAGAAA